MFAWFRRLNKSTATVRRLRGKDPRDTVQVEVAEFAPDILSFLALAASTELFLYEAATQAVLGAPNLEAKTAMADIAADALHKHQVFAAELEKRGKNPATEMERFVTRVNQFTERITTPDWHQHVLSVWLVGGIFDGFFASLALGLKDSYSKEAIAVLRSDSGRTKLEQLLVSEVAADPKLADRLALWGRRLVGDSLLFARDVLQYSDNREFIVDETNPVFTGLTADHMRRMDTLGLTA